MGFIVYVALCMTLASWAGAWSDHDPSLSEKVAELAAQQVLWDERTNAITETVMHELTVLDRQVNMTNVDLRKSKLALARQVENTKESLGLKTATLEAALRFAQNQTRGVEEAMLKITGLLWKQLNIDNTKLNDLETAVAEHAGEITTLVNKIQENQHTESLGETPVGNPVDIDRLRKRMDRMESTIAENKEQYEGDMAFVREKLEELDRKIGMIL